MTLTSTGLHPRNFDGSYRTLLIVYAKEGMEAEALLTQREYVLKGIPSDIIIHNNRDKAFAKAKKMQATEFLEI